jgi:hypothetical protein
VLLKKKPPLPPRRGESKTLLSRAAYLPSRFHLPLPTITTMTPCLAPQAPSTSSARRHPPCHPRRLSSSPPITTLRRETTASSRLPRPTPRPPSVLTLMPETSIGAIGPQNRVRSPSSQQDAQRCSPCAGRVSSTSDKPRLEEARRTRMEARALATVPTRRESCCSWIKGACRAHHVHDFKQGMDTASPSTSRISAKYQPMQCKRARSPCCPAPHA